MEQQGALNRAQSGIAEGKYDFALRRLTEAGEATKPTPAVGAEIGYLKGVCYDGMGSPDEAKVMFKFVADHFPDTEYGYMAKEKLTNDDSFMSVTGPAVFALHDSRFFSSITNRWYILLRPIGGKQIQNGTVVLKFNLHDDGKITDLKVAKNTTTQLLASICQKAVLEIAPYEIWTPEMLKAQGQPYRTITFSFHYRP